MRRGFSKTVVMDAMDAHLWSINSRRALRFTLMLNSEERAELKRRANRLGLSVAGYLRMRAFGRSDAAPTNAPSGPWWPE